MKISIIIPNYNTAHYLPDAIDSVLASDYPNYEIIVVDDGSKDNSKEVILGYAEEKHISYVFQANKGLAGARNTGIEKATGDLLVFLDSDDTIKPDKLSKQAAYLNSHPDCDIVFSKSLYFIENDLSNTRPAELPIWEGLVFEKLLNGNIFLVNAIMARKKAVVEAGAFDSHFRELEDWDLWLRMTLNGSKVGYIPEVLSMVRLRKGSMTNNQTKMYRTMVKVMGKCIPLLRQHPNPPGDRSKLLMKATHSYFAYRILAKERKSFLPALFKSWGDLGFPFSLFALKSIGKYILSYLIKPRNSVTKPHEEVW